MTSSAMNGVATLALIGACSGAPTPREVPAVAVGPDTTAGAPSADPAPPPAPSVDCAALLRDGVRLHDVGRFDEAVAAYRAGYERCGAGHGFLGEVGYSLSAKGDLDAAADAFIAEILEPGPAPTAFGNLATIVGKLSDAKLAAVMATGTKPEKPIRVPDIGYEYMWVQRIACGKGEGVPASQALVEIGGRRLDLLKFHCPDGSEHQAYFDFSADPRERAMQEELREGEGGRE